MVDATRQRPTDTDSLQQGNNKWRRGLGHYQRRIVFQQPAKNLYVTRPWRTQQIQACLSVNIWGREHIRRCMINVPNDFIRSPYFDGPKQGRSTESVHWSWRQGTLQNVCLDLVVMSAPDAQIVKFGTSDWMKVLVPAWLCDHDGILTATRQTAAARWRRGGLGKRIHGQTHITTTMTATGSSARFHEKFKEMNRRRSGSRYACLERGKRKVGWFVLDVERRNKNLQFRRVDGTS